MLTSRVVVLTIVVVLVLSVGLASASVVPLSTGPVGASSAAHPATVASSPGAPSESAAPQRVALLIRPAQLAAQAKLGPDRLEAVPPRQARWQVPLLGAADLARGFDPPPQRWLPGHRGVDVTGIAGTPVMAVDDGRVVFSGPVAGVPVLSIDHAGGLRSTYQPVLAMVQAGERVVAGQVVGLLTDVGGHCASACLHLGARRGEQYVDPALLLGWRAPRLLPLAGSGTL